MDTSKLKPNDPRVSYEKATVNGKTYSYILGTPPSGQEPVDTIFLCHGFPDTSYGWRYQIPVFMSFGFRVICPDMIGYAGTDAPQDLNQYSFKNIAADVKELTRQVIGEEKQIILGGHDWGGAVVFRVALWQPELVSSIFTVCTPYAPPNPEWVELEDIVRTRLPNFAYQLQFAGPDVEREVQGPERIRQLLVAINGGRGPNGENQPGEMMTQGVNFENLKYMKEARTISGDELDVYVSQHMKHEAPQMRGPLNWYRTRKINYEDEKKLLEAKGPEVGLFDIPVLYIGASNDPALPPIMSMGMKKVIKDLTWTEVKATHWALWEAADQVNGIVGEWLEKISGKKLRSSL
ncbi:alpha/beta hydrolase fold domain-containing protein [Sarocladium implicatum]|nr:alpha/beta hydrolase fold domain-containing protein [Sarocladium implicatum]